MDKIRAIDIKDIKFQRDTKVDYENGDVVVNSVFRLFDKNKNGILDPDEWRNYLVVHEKLDDQRERVDDFSNNRVYKYYHRKAENLRKELDRIERKYANYTTPNWDKLCEFNEKHPEIDLMSVESKEQVPAGYEVYEIESFGIGYSDKYGYIKGLENLSQSEQREYLELLNAAIKEANKMLEYEQKHALMLDEYIAMRDLPAYCALNGITEKMSKDDEKSALQNCQAIRNSIANPAYQAIKDIEEKIRTIQGKPDRTETDAQELNRLYTQLYQLRYSSYSWELQDFNFDIGEYPQNGKLFFTSPQFVQVEQQIQIAKTDAQIKDTRLSETSKIALESQNFGENKSVKLLTNTNISISNFDFKSGKSFSSSISATQMNNPFTNENNNQMSGSLSTGGNLGKFSVNSGIDLDYSQYSNTFSPHLSLSNKNYSFNVAERLNINNNNQSVLMRQERPTLSEIFEDNQSFKTSSLISSTNISFNYNNPKVINGGIAVDISEARKSFSGNLSKEISANTNKISISTTPKLTAEYAANSYMNGDGTQATSRNLNITPAVSSSLTYYDPIAKFGARLEVSESYAMTFGENNKFESNNNFTASGYVQHDKFGLGARYNNSSSPLSTSESLGANVFYEPNNKITLSAGYFYSNEKTQEESNTTQNVFTFGGTIRLVK